MDPSPPHAEAVLVVEDDPALQAILRRLLGPSASSVRSACTAEEARDALACGGFDLVICDLCLPDGSALGLLSEVLRRCPAASMLVVSGLDDPAVASQAMRRGAHAYLTKPFTENQLRIALMQARALRSEHDAMTRARERLAHLSESRALERAAASRRVDESLAIANRYRDDAVRSLARVVELRDPDMQGHVERIGVYTGTLAERAGMDGESVGVAGELHDIGKLGIRDGVLLKPGPLVPEERAHIETHAAIGHELLKDSESELLQLAATIAWTHHERFDGSGYPRRLARDEIPLEGQLVGVVDVFDALTSDRVYRRAYSLDRAIDMVVAQRGRQFNPELVDLLVDGVDSLQAAVPDRWEAAPIPA